MNTILFDITLHLYSTCIFVLDCVLTFNYYFKINLSEFQYRVRDKKYTKPNFHKFVILEMSWKHVVLFSFTCSDRVMQTFTCKTKSAFVSNSAHVVLWCVFYETALYNIYNYSTVFYSYHKHDSYDSPQLLVKVAILFRFSYLY